LTGVLTSYPSNSWEKGVACIDLLKIYKQFDFPTSFEINSKRKNIILHASSALSRT